MKLKKSLSLLLVLCLVLSLAPVTAFYARAVTEDYAIRPVESLKESIKLEDSWKVYFGSSDTAQNGNIYWRPFGMDFDGSQYGNLQHTPAQNTVRMVAGGYFTFGTTQYAAAAGLGAYHTSSLKARLDQIAEDYFTDLEEAIIRPRSFIDSTNAVSKPYTEGVFGGSTDNLLWALSYQDITDLQNLENPDDAVLPFPEGGTGIYWLRNGFTTASGVQTVGFVRVADRFKNYGAKKTDDVADILPGIDLDLNKILMFSVIGSGVDGEDNGGKGYGNGAIAELKTTDRNEVKLTLLDTARNFTASTTAVDGKVLTVAYSGAATGNNEFISAIVQDNATGQYSYYGRIKNVKETADAAGTVEITLPEELSLSGKTLYIYNEQYNGDEKDTACATDYASKLVPVTTKALTVPVGTATLADVRLPAGWNWVDATAAVGEAGDKTFAATYDNAYEAGKCVTSVNLTINVVKADQAKPTVTGVNETAEDAKDGKITGVTDKMEYRAESATTWTKVADGATEITGLEPGTYLVRLEETDTLNASEPASVVINSFAHEHTFGTEWKSDANGHWQECACTEKGNAAAHDPEVKNAKPGYTGDKVCKVCGYEIEKGTTVPENPKTGDNALALCVALLLVSCFGIAGVAYFGKKFAIK